MEIKAREHLIPLLLPACSRGCPSKTSDWYTCKSRHLQGPAFPSCHLRSSFLTPCHALAPGMFIAWAGPESELQRDHLRSLGRLSACTSRCCGSALRSQALTLLCVNPAADSGSWRRRVRSGLTDWLPCKLLHQGSKRPIEDLAICLSKVEMAV